VDADDGVLSLAVDALPDVGVLAFDLGLVVTAAHGGALATCGVRDPAAAIGRPLAGVVPRAWEAELAPRLVDPARLEPADVAIGTGTRRPAVRVGLRVLTDEDGEPVGGYLLVRPLGVPAVRDDWFRAAFEHAPIGVAVVSPEGRWLRVNPALGALLGRSEEALRELDVAAVTHPAEVDHDAAVLDRVRSGDAATAQLETRYVCGDGQVAHVQVSVALERASNGVPRHLVFHVQDVAERRMAASRLEHLALHDTLTGLPNRALLVEQLRHALAALERSGERIALLFLDLDRFKNVNDSLGHPIGDQLLGQVARRLRGAVRPGDVVGRLGGDEFVILCQELDDPGTAGTVADRVADALRAPFSLGGHQVAMTASIGIALAAAGDDAADLLRDADAAMYRAKARGRDRHEFFHDALRRGAVERLEIEIGLRRALAEGQLVLHYQPQVRVRDGAVVGVEALVRWQHPERGLVPPGAFLPVAEGTRLIVPIGGWVLDEACRQAAEWVAAVPELRVAVNVSAHQLTGSDFVDSVSGALERHGLAPERLCLEITEGAFVGAMEFASRTLATLVELGIELAVDDFGTGYATFDFVRRVPLHTIKIAGEFMRGMERDRRDAGIVASVLTLARALELTAVAEGVETAAQRDYLRRAGCQLAQGYAYARPAPPAAIGELLRGGQRLQAVDAAGD